MIGFLVPDLSSAERIRGPVTGTRAVAVAAAAVCFRKVRRFMLHSAGWKEIISE
jgi:hypothetical protein